MSLSAKPVQPSLGSVRAADPLPGRVPLFGTRPARPSMKDAAAVRSKPEEAPKPAADVSKVEETRKRPATTDHPASSPKKKQRVAEEATDDISEDESEAESICEPSAAPPKPGEPKKPAAPARKVSNLPQSFFDDLRAKYPDGVPAQIGVPVVSHVVNGSVCVFLPTATQHDRARIQTHARNKRVVAHQDRIFGIYLLYDPKTKQKRILPGTAILVWDPKKPDSVCVAYHSANEDSKPAEPDQDQDMTDYLLSVLGLIRGDEVPDMLDPALFPVGESIYDLLMKRSLDDDDSSDDSISVNNLAVLLAPIASAESPWGYPTIDHAIETKPLISLVENVFSHLTKATATKARARTPKPPKPADSDHEMDEPMEVTPTKPVERAREKSVAPETSRRADGSVVREKSVAPRDDERKKNTETRAAPPREKSVAPRDDERKKSAEARAAPAREKSVPPRDDERKKSAETRAAPPDSTAVVVQIPKVLSDAVVIPRKLLKYAPSLRELGDLRFGDTTDTRILRIYENGPVPSHVKAKLEEQLLSSKAQELTRCITGVPECQSGVCIDPDDSAHPMTHMLPDGSVLRGTLKSVWTPVSDGYAFLVDIASRADEMWISSEDEDEEEEEEEEEEDEADME